MTTYYVYLLFGKEVTDLQSEFCCILKVVVFFRVSCLVIRKLFLGGVKFELRKMGGLESNAGEFSYPGVAHTHVRPMWFMSPL